MNIAFDKSYITKGGTIMHCIYVTPGNVHAVMLQAGDEDDRAIPPIVRLYEVAGGRSLSKDMSDIHSEYDVRQEAWDNLDDHSKDVIRRVVKGFYDKKITGIRLIRAELGFSLAHAKNLFEFNVEKGI